MSLCAEKGSPTVGRPVWANSKFPATDCPSPYCATAPSCQTAKPALLCLHYSSRLLSALSLSSSLDRLQNLRRPKQPRRRRRRLPRGLRPHPCTLRPATMLYLEDYLESEWPLRRSICCLSFQLSRVAPRSQKSVTKWSKKSLRTLFSIGFGKRKAAFRIICFASRFWPLGAPSAYVY